jgi:DNA-binding LytR/AlgR family response regulator
MRINMIKVAICSDKVTAAGGIEKLVFDLCKTKGIPAETEVFYDENTLKQEIEKGTRYDLLYLNFLMENQRGVITAGKIRKLDENVLILYISECDKHMIELFRFDVFAFIKRPVDSQTFGELFLEANRRVCKNNFYFMFRYKGEEYKLPCKEILYFESAGKKIRVNLMNGDAEIFVGKLSDVAERLGNGKIPFLRIHQSYLVNYYWIRARSKTEVTLCNGTKLPISGERKKNFSFIYDMLLKEERNSSFNF